MAGMTAGTARSRCDHAAGAVPLGRLGLGIEDVDRSARRRLVARERDLASDLGLEVGRLHRGLADVEPGAAQADLGRLEGLPDDRGHLLLARADRDLHRHGRPLVDLLAGAWILSEDRARLLLAGDDLLVVGVELEPRLGQSLLGLELRRGSPEVGDGDVARQQEHKRQGGNNEQRHDDRQPPGQPCLLHEHGLAGQQRLGRGAGPAAAGHAQLTEIELGLADVEAASLWAAHLRHAQVDAAGSQLHVALLQVRGLDAGELGHLARQLRAAAPALSLAGVLGQELLALLSGGRRDLEAALAPAPQPDLAPGADVQAGRRPPTRRHLEHALVETKAAFAVGVRRAERDGDGGVGAVVNGELQQSRAGAPTPAVA